MKRFPLLAVLLAMVSPCLAGLNERNWTINGQARTGLVYTPDDNAKKPAAGWPTVFVFHGHGGWGKQVRRGFNIDELWPESIVVYLNGLPTVTPLVDKEGKRPGWDMSSPPEKNKDIQLYDAVLKELIAKDGTDPKRVFIAGHSNGGGFVYTLWSHRADTLAAVESSSASVGVGNWRLSPKPALITAGKNDPIVKFSWQQNTIALVKKINAVQGDGKLWGEDGTWYDSENPLATIIYNGRHGPPKNIGQRAVEFFKAVSPGK